MRRYEHKTAKILSTDKTFKILYQPTSAPIGPRAKS